MNVLALVYLSTLVLICLLHADIFVAKKVIKLADDDLSHLLI